MPKEINTKLQDAALEAMINGGQFKDRRTGRVITAITESDLVERLRDMGWRNLSGWNSPTNWMEDYGFKIERAYGNLNGGTGEWVRVYSDGSEGRTVNKNTTLFSL